MIIVYILYSSSLDKYYIGQTQDLSNRMLEHNEGETKFTASGKPWKLIRFMEVLDRSATVRLEKKIKLSGAKRYLESIGFYEVEFPAILQSTQNSE